MKSIWINIGLLLIGTVAMAQTKTNQPAVRYDAAVHFNSICCGPPDNAFLKKFLNQFAKTNKARPKAWLLGGCGREGEFKILLSYAGISASNKKKLITGLDSLVTKQNSANKTANNSSGNIELQQNPTADDLQGCRTAVTAWKY
jgi:hypothetical protein